MAEQEQAPAPGEAAQRRSRTINTLTCLSGAITATIGLFGVLGRNGGVLDMVLLLAGLAVVLTGLVLRGRSPGKA